MNPNDTWIARADEYEAEQRKWHNLNAITHPGTILFAYLVFFLCGAAFSGM